MGFVEASLPFVALGDFSGTLAHTRRVFHCRIAGRTVAADRADVLAAACGAPIDESVLTLWLLSPIEADGRGSR